MTWLREDFDGDGLAGQILERQSTPLTDEDREQHRLNVLERLKPKRDEKGRVINPVAQNEPKVSVWLI